MVNFVLRSLSLPVSAVFSKPFLAFHGVKLPLCFPFPQLVFSFNDKLFGLLVKDMEAMDPSILKGESGASKKQKVGRRAVVLPAGVCTDLGTAGAWLEAELGLLTAGGVACWLHPAASFALEKIWRIVSSLTQSPHSGVRTEKIQGVSLGLWVLIHGNILS